MKTKILTTLIVFLHAFVALSCPVCESRQPKYLRGITHGAGPESNWDWMIIGVVTAITLLTAIYSTKHLIKPSEWQYNAIKNSVLD
jgi:hypothetical protein